MFPPPPPRCLKSAKIYEKFTKNCSRLSMCTTSVEKKSYTCHPGIEFLTPVATWSGQYTWIVVLASQIRFLLFKGPWSFKTIFKIHVNVDELKAYRLIPLTPPFLFHFTLPLKNCFIRPSILFTCCNKILQFWRIVTDLAVSWIALTLDESNVLSWIGGNASKLSMMTFAYHSACYFFMTKTFVESLQYAKFKKYFSLFQMSSLSGLLLLVTSLVLLS